MPHAVDLRHLRYFVAVAEELSFTRAAQRLGMAQPPLSQQIRQLEASVGSALLVRTPRVALTEAGHVLLEVARRTLAQVDQGLDAARRVGRGDAGRLSVGFASSVVLTALPRAFRAFKARYPGVELELREMHSGAQLDALRAATIDVGLLRESPEDDDLISEIVVRERFIALLPIGHRLAARTRVAPSALAAESFIMFQRDVAPTLHDQIAAVCREGDFSPRVKHEANEWLTVAGLVGAGMGVSIAPAGVRQLRWRGVAYRPIRPSRVQTSITVCRRREPSRGAIDAFVGILREVTGHDAAK